MRDVSIEARPQIRTGATPVRSGLTTLLFFALITAVVATAGIVGVVLWGPEKEIKTRSHFATDPMAEIAPSLPSLPAVESADPPLVAPAADTSTPAEPAASTKKAKKARAKKGR